MSILSVGVFCGAKDGIDNKYTDLTIECGKRLAENNLRLVYGGSNSGLMKLVCDAVFNNGGEVTGVYPKFMHESEPIRGSNINELIIADDMFDRKKIMLEKSDAFFILPGGYGTLDEAFEVMTLKKLNLLKKEIIFINHMGYWDLILPLLAKIEEEGFAKEGEMFANIYMAKDLDEAFARIGF